MTWPGFNVTLQSTRTQLLFGRAGSTISCNFCGPHDGAGAAASASGANQPVAASPAITTEKRELFNTPNPL
jgi:hypothetical protein